jgi:hypothetical protein
MPMALSCGDSKARRPDFCDAIGKSRAQPIQYKQKFVSLITYIMLNDDLSYDYLACHPKCHCDHHQVLSQ